LLHRREHRYHDKLRIRYPNRVHVRDRSPVGPRMGADTQTVLAGRFPERWKVPPAWSPSAHPPPFANTTSLAAWKAFGTARLRALALERADHPDRMCRQISYLSPPQ